MPLCTRRARATIRGGETRRYTDSIRQPGIVPSKINNFANFQLPVVVRCRQLQSASLLVAG
jgi:hypothetical protein